MGDPKEVRIGSVFPPGRPPSGSVKSTEKNQDHIEALVRNYKLSKEIESCCADPRKEVERGQEKKTLEKDAQDEQMQEINCQMKSCKHLSTNFLCHSWPLQLDQGSAMSPVPNFLRSPKHQTYKASVKTSVLVRHTRKITDKKSKVYAKTFK